MARDKVHRPRPGQGSWGSWETQPLQTVSTGFLEALRPCVDCRQPLPIRGVGTDKLLHARPKVQSECRRGQDGQSRALPSGCARIILQEAGVEGMRGVENVCSAQHPLGRTWANFGPCCPHSRLSSEGAAPGGGVHQGEAGLPGLSGRLPRGMVGGDRHQPSVWFFHTTPHPTPHAHTQTSAS